MEDKIQVLLLYQTNSKTTSTSKIVTRSCPTLTFTYRRNPSLLLKFVYKNSTFTYKLAELFPFSIISLSESLKLTISTLLSGVAFMKRISNVPRIMTSSFISLKCPLCKKRTPSFQTIEQLGLHLKFSHEYVKIDLLYKNKSVYFFEIVENHLDIDSVYLSRSFRLDSSTFSLVPLSFSFWSRNKHRKLQKSYLESYNVTPQQIVYTPFLQNLHGEPHSADYNLNFSTFMTMNGCSNTTKKEHFDNRIFVDSLWMQPLPPGSTSSSVKTDSEAAICTALIHDFCDLSNEEKIIMTKWNNLQSYL